MTDKDYDKNQWRYINEIKKYPILTDEEEKQLGYLLKNGTKEQQEYARKRLIECNLRLVNKIALDCIKGKKINNIILDMIQEGNLGLIKAVEKYDPEFDNRFSTYAVWWIRKKIILALEKTETIKKSHEINTQMKVLHKIENQLESSKDNIPSYEEIVSEFNRLNNTKKQMTIKEYYDLLLSDEPISIEENNKVLEEKLVDSNIDIENEVINNIYNTQLEKALKEIIKESLNEKEKDIIIRRYGLKTDKKETLKEIADDYNCTGESIRQIEKKALKKLNKTLKLSKYRNII